MIRPHIHRRSSIREGFTIVELLIVIVIISILAAITIVAYNGISDRAYVTRTNSNGRQIGRAIATYGAQNGSYPASGATAICIGSAADYPAADGFVAGSCSRTETGTDTADQFIDSTLGNFVTGLTGKDVKAVTATGEGMVYRGIRYGTATSSDGIVARISWHFSGTKTCGGGGIHEDTSNPNFTFCRLTVPAL